MQNCFIDFYRLLSINLSINPDLGADLLNNMKKSLPFFKKKPKHRICS